MRAKKGKKQFKHCLAFLATVTVQQVKRLKKFKKSLDKLENCYIMVTSQAIKRYIISLDKLIKLLYNEYKLNKTYAMRICRLAMPMMYLCGKFRV